MVDVPYLGADAHPSLALRGAVLEERQQRRHVRALLLAGRHRISMESCGRDGRQLVFFFFFADGMIQVESGDCIPIGY